MSPRGRHTEGVGERSGLESAAVAAAVRCETLRPSPPARLPGRRPVKLKLLISPTPSVVDRDRRCRSAIAMLSLLFGSRRPV